MTECLLSARSRLSALHYSHSTDKHMRLREGKCLAQGHTASECLADLQLNLTLELSFGTSALLPPCVCVCVCVCE